MTWVQEQLDDEAIFPSKIGMQGCFVLFCLGEIYAYIQLCEENAVNVLLAFPSHQFPACYFSLSRLQVYIIAIAHLAGFSEDSNKGRSFYMRSNQHEGYDKADIFTTSLSLSLSLSLSFSLSFSLFLSLFLSLFPSLFLSLFLFLSLSSLLKYDQW